MRRGLVAEFDSPAACASAVEVLKRRGLRKLDVYMPYPVKEIQQALEIKASPLPRIVFVAGSLGAILAYAILWLTNVYDYPLNVAGRPSHAVPAFIPITFETTVLFAGGAAFFGALLLGRMPRLYHPIDETAEFQRACVDRFLLAVDATNDGFDDQHEIRARLEELGAQSVREFGDPERVREPSEPAAEDAP